MTPSERDALLTQVTRTSFSHFVAKAFTALNPGEEFKPNWHVEAMCHELTKTKTGDTKRLLITLPPRHLKSFCGSIAYPAWVLGHDPSQKIAVVSYGEALSGNLHDGFRALIETPFYKRVFPNVVARRGTADNFVTTQRGGRRAVTVGGALTGFGANTIIIDDPVKAIDARRPLERERLKDFYDQTLVSRLNNQAEGVIITIAQRLHEDDLPAYLMDKGTFVHLDLPAIAEEDRTYEIGRGRVHHRKCGDVLFPQHLSAETLAQTRTEIGAAPFAAQYQQNPASADAARVRWHDIKTYDERPEDPPEFVVQSWDTAAGLSERGDFSVCTTWVKKWRLWHLLHVDRTQGDYAAQRDLARAVRNRSKPDVILIERASTGPSLYVDLRKDLYRGHYRSQKPQRIVLPRQQRLDKETRFQVHVDRLYSGDYLLPKQAPWLADLKKEMQAFPNGRHDDQVDSIMQFIHWAEALRRDGIGEDRARGGRYDRRYR